MKSFNVYERNESYKAVKNGWSWPAFFFGSVWAMCMQLWLIGLIIFPVQLLLHMLINTLVEMSRNTTGSYAESINLVLFFLILIPVLIRLIFGLYGNSWKRKRLEKSSYRLVKKTYADNKNKAISTCKPLK
mgnify:FL=1